MRAAVIVQGTVTNIIEVKSLDGFVDAEGAKIGDTYNQESGFVTPEIVAKIPESVTMRQARQALLDAGALDAVELEVAKQGGILKIFWETSQNVERDNKIVVEMAEILEFSNEMLDNLFLLAASKN